MVSCCGEVKNEVRAAAGVARGHYMAVASCSHLSVLLGLKLQSPVFWPKKLVAISDSTCARLAMIAGGGRHGERLLKSVAAAVIWWPSARRGGGGQPLNIRG